MGRGALMLGVSSILVDCTLGKISKGHIDALPEAYGTAQSLLEAY